MTGAAPPASPREGGRLAALVERAAASQLLRFCVVGSVGFLVDAGSLRAILALSHAGPYLGRLASYLLAATITWALNRSFTFRAPRERTSSGEWARYVAVNAVGGGINYATYAALIALSAIARSMPVLGVAAGSLAGLGVNFLASKHLVFRTDRVSAPT